jgi:hypothetical protein
MRGERALLRVGESLVRRACRRLPGTARDDRYREWAAELPAILHDSEIRLAPCRAFRMLAYAADTLRGTALTPGAARRQPAATWTTLSLVAGLALAAWSIWRIVQAPEHWVNYAYLAWSMLLAAWPLSQYVRSTARMTGLLAASSCLAGAVVYCWNAALAPGDWVNYLAAAWFLLPVLLWLVRPGGPAVVRRLAGSWSGRTPGR